MGRLPETGPSGCCVAGRRGKRAIDQDGDVFVLVVEDVGQPPILVQPAADRDEHRDVPNFTTPTAFQAHAVEVDVRKRARDGPLPRSLDLIVYLLIRPTDRARAHPRAPQRLGDVLDAAHAHARQIPYTRMYYGHMHDMLTTTFNTAYMSYWTNHYGELGDENFDDILDVISSRAEDAERLLPAQVPFEITSHDGSDVSVDTATLALEGTAWINVKDVLVEGLPDPLERIS